MPFGPKEYIKVVLRRMRQRLTSSGFLSCVGFGGLVVTALLLHFKADQSALNYSEYLAAGLTGAAFLFAVFAAQYDAWRTERELAPDIGGDFYGIKINNTIESGGSHLACGLLLFAGRARVSVREVKVALTNLSGDTEVISVTLSYNYVAGQPLILEPMVHQSLSVSFVSATDFSFIKHMEVIVVDARGTEHRIKSTKRLPFPFAQPFGTEEL